MDNIFNTSYGQKYTVVRMEGDSAVLRVTDESLYNTYWKAFISADVLAEAPPLTIRVEQVPSETTIVRQYESFTPELPIVYVEAGGMAVDVSSHVTSTSPNTDVPGLYRVDYMLSIDAHTLAPFWSSYVSVQQPSLLRKAAATWNRENYAIQTLNRLVMEPQFMEALHAAGESLYGFASMNHAQCLSPAAISEYAGMDIWGIGIDSANALFITGAPLPEGVRVVWNGFTLRLRATVLTSAYVSDNEYDIGDIARLPDATYLCIQKNTHDDADGNMVSKGPQNPKYWIRGNVYRFECLENPEVVVPTGRLPIQKNGVSHVWATVDLQGYAFMVDILHETSLGIYRGYYERTSMPDYAPGDLVSYISENSVGIYKRKATDVLPGKSSAYPPGHHLNPDWEEVYREILGESPTQLEYTIIPHSNAANAVVAKTWTSSDDICRAYAHLMNIPDAIVDACGPKMSAFLFALLTRTRNTFEGLRICLNATGLSLSNFEWKNPGMAYSEGAAQTPIPGVYETIASLKKLLPHISTLRPIGMEEAEKDNLRYRREAANPNDAIIDQYDGNDWVEVYRVHQLPAPDIRNNRVFSGDLGYLHRIAENAVMEFGDGHQWIAASAFAGKVSNLVGAIEHYEIPIYIVFALHIYLYDLINVKVHTYMHQGAGDSGTGAIQSRLALHPTKLWNRITREWVVVPTGVYKVDDGGEHVLVPDEYQEGDIVGVRYYSAPMPGDWKYLTIHASVDTFVFERYWKSTHDYGKLYKEDNGALVDVSYVSEDHTPLVLANGNVGITPVYKYPELAAPGAWGICWNYVFGNTEDDGWHLSNDVPFSNIQYFEVENGLGFPGTFAELKSQLAYVSGSPYLADGGLYWWWDDTGRILGIVDSPDIVYLFNAEHTILASYRPKYPRGKATYADYLEYGILPLALVYE